MKKLIFATFLIQTIVSISTHSEKFLHVYDDNLSENIKPLVIKNTDKHLVEALHTRYRRDLSSDRNEGFKNITTRVSGFSPLFRLIKSKLSVNKTRLCSIAADMMVLNNLGGPKRVFWKIKF